MWNSGSRPRCSAMRMKLGEETVVPVTPRPSPKPFATTVLPAPRSPHRQMTSPALATRPSRAPNAAVSAAESVRRVSSDRARVGTRPSVPESGEALEVAQGDGDRRSLAEADQASLEHHPGGEPARTGEAEPRALGAGERAGPDADEVAGRVGEVDVGIVDDEARRVGDDRDGPALEGLEHRHDGGGDRPPAGAVEDEDRERRQPVDAGPTPFLRGQEVVALLDPEGRDDDPAHAHRPGPRQRLRIDPGPGDEDRAGGPDVDLGSSQLTVRASRDVEPARRRPGEDLGAEDALRGRLEADADPVADLPDDAGEGCVQWLGAVRRGDPPATAGSEEQLSARDAGLVLGRGGAGWRPTVAGSLGALRARPRHDHGLRVAQAVRHRGAPDDGLARCDERPVARPEREPGLDRAGDQLPPRHEGEARGRRRLGRHAVSPGHASSPQAASAARRRSRRSGNRSGTSRRSTSTPARPPDTGTETRRVRRPSRTTLRNVSVASARSPGGRSTNARSPGRRSCSLVAVLSPSSRMEPTGTPRRRTVGIPPTTTTVPIGARRSSARSATTGRRSSGSSIVPSGPSRRAWSMASWVAPARRTTSAIASATAWPGARAKTPPAEIVRSGAGIALSSGVSATSRDSAARAAASRSRAPSPEASAHGFERRSRSRSPIRWRSRLPVVQARTESTVPCSGSASMSPARALLTATATGPWSATPGEAIARKPPSRPISMSSIRRARTSARLIAARTAVKRVSDERGRRPSRISRSGSSGPLRTRSGGA